MTAQSERRHVPYTPEQMFDLVADVERYPTFLPWLLAAHIRRRDGDTLWVDMRVGANLLRKEFTSIARLNRPKRIEISSNDPMFETFEQTWIFEPADDGGAIISYHIDFQFRSRLLHAVMGSRFADMAATMMHAFRRRARRIYGTV